MSLNGLEAVEVNEAYQLALGEGGGWFLLQYMSRDAVGLLEKGSGGLAEVQETINRYNEQSPLFGFIQYRRRKVILKYLPEGTSRLLQARVSVHAQSITEKLSPHDSIFEFTSMAELQGSTLSSACSLHSAAASIKSSNESLPSRGLTGITEDVSDSRTDDNHDRNSEGAIERKSLSRQISGESKTRPGEVNEVASAKYSHQKSSSVTTQKSLHRARTISNVDKALPPTPRETERDEIQSRAGLEHGEILGRTSGEGRMSSQSARPSTLELYDAYGYKQKVKVGPRPSLDSGGRSENPDRSNDVRPVSTLPAGVRIPARKVVPHKTMSPRPQSQQSQRTHYESVSPRQLPLAAPVTPIQIPDWKRSIISNGLLTPAKTPSEVNTPQETPERSRLMKALQLRQKQLAAQKPTKDSITEETFIEAKYPKPEIDESILSAIIDTSNPDVDPDMVDMGAKDLGRDAPQNAEDSPISIPEVSEGPSTQASSITDEDENTYSIERASNREFPVLAPIVNGTISNDSDEDTLRERHGTSELVPNKGDPDCDRPGEDSDTKQQQIDAADAARINQLIPELHQISFSEPSNLTTKPQPSSLLDHGYATTFTPPLMTESEVYIEDSTCHLEKAGQASVTGNEATTATIQSSTKKSTLPMTKPHPSLMKSEMKHTEYPSIGLNQGADPPTASTASVDGNEQSSEHDVSSTGKSDVKETFVKSLEPLQSHNPSAHNAVDPSTKNVNVPLPAADNYDEKRHDHQQASPTPQPSAAKPDYQPTLSLTRRRSEDSDLTPIQPSTSEGVHEEQVARQVRRRGLVNPPERLSSPEYSDEHFLSDDSFMEELKSATMQEAKPISVSKSPIKPVFSRSDSDQRLVDTSKANRSVSSPLNHSSKDEEDSSSPRMPTPQSSRSFSATQFLRSDAQQASGQMPKKIGVSSGISQRIKALEQLSSRPTSPQSTGPSSTSTFISLRKTSIRTPQVAPSPINNTKTKSHPITTYPSPSPSPEMLKPHPSTNADLLGSSRPNSISVTATIVRDANHKTPEMPLNPSKPQHLDLHPSPLVVEHGKMGPPPLSPLKPPRPRYARHSSARSGSSSSTEQKLEAPHPTRRDSFASMLSRSSRAGSDVELKSTFSDSSYSGAASPDEIREEKKDSKRTRLMKRMSSISSMSRKSIANVLNPSPKEIPVLERQETITETPSTLVDVGDVNIQFPDTLLWKRRHMVVDEQGILVLSASKADNNLKVVTKKFPLSEFRYPYIPDQDRQELANSVILDFKDGSTLQCACENPQGQAGVLQTLREAHSFHQSQ